MKKRILTVLLAVCLVFALGTVTALAADEGELQTQINNITDVGTITLSSDTTESITIPSGKTITLNLGSFKLTNSGNNDTITVENGGTLIITGVGTVDNISNGKGALVNFSGGTVTIGGNEGDNITLSRSAEASGNSWYVIKNMGVMTIDKGVTVKYSDSNTGTGSSLIANGWYGNASNDRNTTYAGVNAVLTINDGTFTGGMNTVKNDDGSELTINNGSFSNTGGPVILNWNIATINNGTFTGTAANKALLANGYLNNNADVGEFTINGGTFTSSSDGNGSLFGYGDTTTTGGVIKINNGTFKGNIAASYYEIEIDGGDFTGAIQDNVSTASITITAGKFTAENVSDFFPDGQALTVDESGNVIVDRESAKAYIGSVGYETLDAAIGDATNGDVITLVADADINITAGAPLVIDDDVTIDGNGMHKINLTLTDTNHSNGRDKILQIKSADVEFTDVELNITGFNDTSKGFCGDAIDFPAADAHLTLTNSEVNIGKVAGAFVLQSTPENIVVNNSVINVDNVRGNASQGGSWVVNDSTINISNCDDHGLSVTSLEVTNSDIKIDKVGQMAIFGVDLDFLGDTTVTVTNSGSKLPNEDGYAGTLGGYHAPIQVKKGDGASLNVAESATIVMSGNKGTEGSIDTIYIPEGATFTSTGTVNATVELGDADMNLVTVINRDSTTMTLVADGNKFPLPNPGTYNGYTFGGWRSGYNIYKAGESVTVYNDMTFTAIWNAINVPDTYPITVSDAANGEVSTSLSNASQGSVITVTAEPDDGYTVGSVTVTGPDGRVDVKRVNATTYTFVMPDGAVTVSVSFASETMPFTDVTTGDWFYDEVYYVWANGMMEGVSDTSFNPNGTMTRAMFWAVLGRIDGQTITGSNWAAQARDWAVAEGVSDGENPNALVTREQMVTMLWRYAGEPAGTGSLTGYTDADSVSDWAETAMSWAIGSGIIDGMSATTIVPGGTATRAQCAAIFMRYDTL